MQGENKKQKAQFPAAAVRSDGAGDGGVDGAAFGDGGAE